MRARLLLLALAAAAAHCEAHTVRRCIMPHYADGPPGAPPAEKCSEDRECCGALICGADGLCGANATQLNAAEQAYVAHLVVADCLDHATAMALDLDTASQAVANASRAVKRAVARAHKHVADAADATAEKAHNISARLREKHARAKKSAQHTMNELDAEGRAVVANVSARADNMRAKSSSGSQQGASSGAGGDYSKYYKGYASGGAAGGADDSSKAHSQHHKKKHHGKTDAKAGSGGAGAGGAGFDYSKYVPGGDNKAADSKKSGGAATGGAGSGGAGFDYSKYIPGGDSKKETTTDDKKKQEHKKSKKGGDDGSQGFDYSKYVPGGSGGSPSSSSSSSSTNMRAHGEQPQQPLPIQRKAGRRNFGAYRGSQMLAVAAEDAGFDWRMALSANGVDHSDHENPRDPDTRVASPERPHSGAEKPHFSTANMKQQTPVHGNKEGKPCGATPYKDFGACRSGLKCETHELFTAFAPGKCVANVSPENDDDKDAQRRQLRSSSGESGKNEKQLAKPGAEGGPCGPWELGGMDFGDCNEGLECSRQASVTVSFDGKEYGEPRVCENAGSEAANATSMLADGDDGAVDDDDSDALDAVDGAVDSAADSAKRIAARASATAQRAADEAEVLAHKLLASAARVRAAAQELHREAQDCGDDDNDDDESVDGDDDVDDDDVKDAPLSSMLEVPLEAARATYWPLTMMGVGALGLGVLYQKWRGDGHAYRRMI